MREREREREREGGGGLAYWRWFQWSFQIFYFGDIWYKYVLDTNVDPGE